MPEFQSNATDPSGAPIPTTKAFTGYQPKAPSMGKTPIAFEEGMGKDLAAFGKWISEAKAEIEKLTPSPERASGDEVPSGSSESLSPSVKRSKPRIPKSQRSPIVKGNEMKDDEDPGRGGTGAARPPTPPHSGHLSERGPHCLSPTDKHLVIMGETTR